MLKTIDGMKPSTFATVAAVVLAGLYLEVLPNNMVTGFTVTMVLGGFLAWLGNSIPCIRVFGGAALLCIFVPCLLVEFGLLPRSGVEIISHFLTDSGVLDFVVSALIVGSLLSMNREILVKAGVRFLMPILSAVTGAFIIGGLAGHLTGFGFSDAILFVVAPIMGGGITAGAIPMSEIYATRAGGTATEYISLLVPAIMVANVFCILIAATLSGLGNKNSQMFAGFSGDGQMLRPEKFKLSAVADGDNMETPTSGTFIVMAAGIVIAGTLYILGQVLESIVPIVHAYAWMVIISAFIKIFDLSPAFVAEAAGQWYGFISRTLIPAILVAVSIGLIDVDQITAVLSNSLYLGMTILTTVIASVAAGVVGWLVGMHYVEASITGGLCMADVGGSGDVAVLGASERMHLLPFAQMASRLGGALMLVIMSVLVPILM